MVRLSGRKGSQRFGKDPDLAVACRSRKEFVCIPEHRGKPLEGFKQEVIYVSAESLWLLCGELTGGVQE